MVDSAAGWVTRSGAVFNFCRVHASFSARCFGEEQQIGWIAAIIIGGIASWLAELFMKSQMGLVINVVLGIIGGTM